MVETAETAAAEEMAVAQAEMVETAAMTTGAAAAVEAALPPGAMDKTTPEFQSV
jgi:hypothetical protein